MYVKTKNTNYIEGSRFLRTVVKHIKKILKSDSECKRRLIKFRNINYEYGSSYTLKGMHLLIQLLEYESFDDEEDYSCINVTDEKDIIID